MSKSECSKQSVNVNADAGGRAALLGWRVFVFVRQKDGLCVAWHVERRRILVGSLYPRPHATVRDIISRAMRTRQRVRNDLKETVEGTGIARREVKFYDPRKTSRSEGVCQGRFL